MMIFPKHGVGMTGMGLAGSAEPAALQAVGIAEIAPMMARHAVLRSLCLELEDCANRLPDRHVMHRAAMVSAGLATNLRDCEALGRAVWSRIFGADCEAFDGLPGDGLPGGGLTRRMRQYHAADALHAEDLHDALAMSVARHDQNPEPGQTDMLGYMMRCLFDGCRRCIDCREAALLLLGREHMSAGAVAALTASLESV